MKHLIRLNFVSELATEEFMSVVQTILETAENNGLMMITDEQYEEKSFGANKAKATAYVVPAERHPSLERRKMTVSEQLLIAADLIEERGHCKHMARHQDGSICIGQAINEVVGGGDTDRSLMTWNRYDEAARTLAYSLTNSRSEDYGVYGIDPYLEICGFNNLSTTNKDVAVAKLREVAEALVSVSK